MALNLARTVLNKLKLCSLCNNRNSNNTDQLVISNQIANMTDQIIELKNSTSSFSLDDLLTINGTSETVTASVSCL